MANDYNHEAAKAFVQALRDGDREEALYCANGVTMDPDAVNSSVPLDREYNDTELADLIEGHLSGIDQGRWDMTSQVHLPVVIGAIYYWITKEQHREDDGEVSSESLEPSEEQDSTGP